ncbi:Serine/threonine-protein kinase PknD [Pirellulimonas nuda]|uniref:Serine/threonine-protein kinase PknD n=1 Tax=Pirellulimonas nuda TaxID=2528009 RepID=A0A518DGK0_9BACT|nr:NHL repeat-containing protein [Pirellulimonas nuda]QDU90603.1 Serine/threonine-protein kinase PknD [Pirellulimonas nuda]
MLTRRCFLASSCGALLAGAAGCGDDPGGLARLDVVWGRRGLADGRFQKPRAMAIDQADRLYIVDFTARIQVFDADGKFLHLWRTPEWRHGRPTGLTVAGDDRLLVADTHYYRVLPYTLAGRLLEDQVLGGVNGNAPGEFGFVTDAVYDSKGCLYVSEYGQFDRIQKFAPDGSFLLQWGTHGSAPGQFVRPQNLLFDAQDRLWVCDACNHRIQAFSTEGELLLFWGNEGSSPGQLYYPYDIAMDTRGDLLVVEYGNHRVQKFNQQGQSMGTWGRLGAAPGELRDPWSLVLDSRGRLNVLDTGNNRVQRVLL